MCDCNRTKTEILLLNFLSYSEAQSPPSHLRPGKIHPLHQAIMRLYVIPLFALSTLLPLILATPPPMRQVLITWGPEPVTHTTILTALHTLERHVRLPYSPPPTQKHPFLTTPLPQGGHIEQIFQVVQGFLAMAPQAAIDAVQETSGPHRPIIEDFAYIPHAAHLVSHIFRRPLTMASHAPSAASLAPPY